LTSTSVLNLYLTQPNLENQKTIIYTKDDDSFIFSHLKRYYQSKAPLKTPHTPKTLQIRALFFFSLMLTTSISYTHK